MGNPKAESRRRMWTRKGPWKVPAQLAMENLDGILLQEKENAWKGGWEKNSDVKY